MPTDRIEVDILAWGRGLQSWLVEHIVIGHGPGDPAAWAALDDLLGRTWRPPSTPGRAAPASRDALLDARAKAVRTVEFEDRRVSYATDAAMAAAIADLERRIDAAGTSGRRRIVRTTSGKGL